MNNSFGGRVVASRSLASNVSRPQINGTTKILCETVGLDMPFAKFAQGYSTNGVKK